MAGPQTSNGESQPPRRASASTWILSLAVFAGTLALGTYILRPSANSPPQQKLAELASPEQGERISIPSLGLSIVRPPSWVTVTADQNAKNLRSVQMDDPEFQELAARYASSPIVAIAKYREPYADLNPSLKINVRPLGGFAGHSPEDILQVALPMFRRGFGKIEVLEGPTRTTLAGRQAGFARVAYTLRANGKEFPTVSEIWTVPSGSVFFMIGTGTRADERNGSRAEIRSILNSLRIE